MSVESVDGEQLAFVLSSGYRQDVLTDLADGSKTPSTLEADTGIDSPHVSRTLSECRDAGLVELLVPEDTAKGRLYGLTDDGRAIVEDASGVLERNGGGSA